MFGAPGGGLGMSGQNGVDSATVRPIFAAMRVPRRKWRAQCQIMRVGPSPAADRPGVAATY
ncbi:MAG TPA: hypothetical protein VFH92_04915, partial [Phenylobacterium sp.]|nr:hypothetical protein [Phenylobacterium sp.]